MSKETFTYRGTLSRMSRGMAIVAIASVVALAAGAPAMAQCQGDDCMEQREVPATELLGAQLCDPHCAIETEPYVTHPDYRESQDVLNIGEPCPNYPHCRETAEAAFVGEGTETGGVEGGDSKPCQQPCIPNLDPDAENTSVAPNEIRFGEPCPYTDCAIETELCPNYPHCREIIEVASVGEGAVGAETDSHDAADSIPCNNPWTPSCEPDVKNASTAPNEIRVGEPCQNPPHCAIETEPCASPPNCRETVEAASVGVGAEADGVEARDSKACIQPCTPSCGPDAENTTTALNEIPFGDPCPTAPNCKRVAGAVEDVDALLDRLDAEAEIAEAERAAAEIASARQTEKAAARGRASGDEVPDDHRTESEEGAEARFCPSECAIAIEPCQTPNCD